MIVKGHYVKVSLPPDLLDDVEGLLHIYQRRWDINTGLDYHTRRVLVRVQKARNQKVMDAAKVLGLKLVCGCTDLETAPLSVTSRYKGELDPDLYLDDCMGCEETIDLGTWEIVSNPLTQAEIQGA